MAVFGSAAFGTSFFGTDPALPSRGVAVSGTAAISTLQIGRPGWQGMVSLPCVDLSMSWVLSDAGTLTATIMSHDFHRLYTDQYLSSWVRWEHADAGVWAGEVRAVQSNAANKTMEIEARTFHALLIGRPTAFLRTPSTLPPGSIVQRALVQANSRAPLLLEDIAIGSGGEVQEWTWRGEDTFQTVSQVASQANWQWHIDEDRNFIFARKIGAVKTGTVLLWEGKHLSELHDASTVDGMVNGVLMVNTVEAKKNQREISFRSNISDRIYRLQEQTLDVGLQTSRQAIRSFGRRYIEEHDIPIGTLQATVLNYNGAWSGWREGDSILIGSTSRNRVIQATVLSRALNPKAGTMEITLSEDDTSV